MTTPQFLISAVHKVLDDRAIIRYFKNNIWVVDPGFKARALYYSSRVSYINLANELTKEIPIEFLESQVTVGSSGATEGLFIVRLQKGLVPREQ